VQNAPGDNSLQIPVVLSFLVIIATLTLQLSLHRSTKKEKAHLATQVVQTFRDKILWKYLHQYGQRKKACGREMITKVE